MANNFNIDKAERALEIAMSKSDNKFLDENLEAAKKIYDFLVGKSHHFLNNETK
jgi:chromosome segregation ATPase